MARSALAACLLLLLATIHPPPRPGGFRPPATPTTTTPTSIAISGATTTTTTVTTSDFPAIGDEFPDAAEVWAREGGGPDPSVYPDDATRRPGEARSKR